MPKILRFGQYVIFFWTGENDEPIHVHVAVKRPEKHSTKIWLTRSGGCVLANNNRAIPEKDLRDILELVAANHSLICDWWRKTFSVEPTFYC